MGRAPLLLVAVMAAALGGWGTVRWLQSRPQPFPVIEVWKSQTCGCCVDWIAYVRERGYTVQVHDVDDVDPVAEQFHVPLELRSCHTARVAGYVLEGHVPVEIIARLVTERPPGIAGVAVPDMAEGAPGMDDDGDTPYAVVAFGDGQTRLMEPRLTAH